MSTDACAALLLQLAGKDERIAELEATVKSQAAHLASMQARIDGLEGRINGVSRGGE
jgi:hypothetical protein